MGQEFPSDYGLELYHSCDVYPDCPDNAAGVTYKADWSSTVDSWVANTGNAISVDTNRLKMVYTSGTNNGCSAYRIFSFASKMIRFSVTSTNIIQKVRIRHYAVAGTPTDITVTTPTRKDSDYVWLIDVSPITNVNLVAINVNNGISVDVGNISYLTFFYCGSGAYDTLLPDDAWGVRTKTAIAVTPVTGVRNKGLYFNGVSAYLKSSATLTSIPDNQCFSFEYIGAQSLSTSATFYNYKTVSSTVGFYLIYRPSGTDTLRVRYSSGATADVNFTGYFTGYDNIRCSIFLCINWSTYAINVYRNGVFFSSLNMTTPIKPTSGSYEYVGSYQGSSNFFIGVIDELRKYSRALSAADILNLYTNIVRPVYLPVSPSVEKNTSSAVSVYIVDSTASGFNLTSTIDNYETLIFERQLSGVGKFSFVIMADSLQAKYVKVNSFIIVSSAYGQAQSRIGIITAIDRGVSTEHKRTYKVSGMEAKGICQWRIIVPNSGSAYFTGTAVAENIFKSVMAYQGGASTAATARKFTGLTVAPTQGRGTSYVFSERYTNLATVFERLSLASKIGWAITWSGTGLLFDVIVGKNRTLGNGVYTSAILSTNFDSVQESHLVSDQSSYKTYNYVGGPGVGTARTIRTTYLGSGEPSNVERKEIFTDARDLSSTSDLDAKGASVLAETNYPDYTEADLNPYSLFIKTSGADLGDYITVESYGYQMTSQITGITEQWSKAGYETSLALDKQPATLTTAIGSDRYKLVRLSTSAES